MLKNIVSLSFAVLLFAGCGEKQKQDNPPPADLVKTHSLKNTESAFFFVGIVDENPGIYRYDFTTKQSSVIWSHKKEKVIEFSQNDDKSKGYFITVSQFGKDGAFPFVRGVKVYAIDLKTLKATEIKKLGNGLQLVAYWEGFNAFKVVMNSIDVTVATYVEQYSGSFTTEGKILFESKKTYNLTKDGYPQLPSIEPALNSPSGTMRLRTDEKNEIQFSPPKGRRFTISGPSSEKLRQVQWTIDESFLVYTTINVTPDNESLYDKNPQTSTLYIFDCSKQEITATVTGAGYKNFAIFGNILAYDTHFGEQSTIVLFDLSIGKQIGIIEIKGGCGLKNIPLIPDYSA